MDSRLFLTIVAALGALYGIAFVLFPSASLALYGNSGTSAAQGPKCEQELAHLQIR
jgi:hypothetical protein